MVGLIKKDVNKRLLFFVIVLLMLLIASAIYYEVRLKILLTQYNKNQEIFGGLTANAVIEELNKTSSIKETVHKYKEYLEKRYDDLNTLNKNLKDQIEDINAELTLIKSQIEYQKAREIGPTEHFRLFQNKNEEIAKLKKKVDELCSELKEFNITKKEC